MLKELKGIFVYVRAFPYFNKLPENAKTFTILKTFAVIFQHAFEMFGSKSKSFPKNLRFTSFYYVVQKWFRHPLRPLCIPREEFFKLLNKDESG